MIVVAIRALFERSRLEFGRRGVALQRSIIRTGQRHQFPPEAIQAIDVDRSGTEVNGVPYWKVVLRTVDGKEHTLATEIKSRQAADRLASEIGRAAKPAPSAKGADASPILLEGELPAEFQR
jgi:hypothetical protein